MIKKLNIIIVFMLSVSFLYAAGKDKKYTSLFVGECSLDIPYAYQVLARKKFLVFNDGKIFRTSTGDTNSYTLKWEKFDIDKIVQDYRIEKIIEKRSNGHITLYQVKSKDRKMFFIVGNTFYIHALYAYDKYTEHLINSCVYSSGEKPYTEDNIDLFIDELKKDFLLMKNEPKYIVKAIFPDVNISIDRTDTVDDEFIKLKMRKYLEKYCVSKECIFFGHSVPF